jgi:glycosyltransferase involved in cell wall biosynthesis
MAVIDVTVVVCTYNRAALLHRALASLAALQTAGRFQYEIVVIDNASTDETAQVIAQAAQTTPVPLRGVYEAQPGVSAARNRGIREAAGEWIAFFDDDQEADPRWLHELLSTAADKQVRCACGVIRLRLDSQDQARLAFACRELLGELEARQAAGCFSRRCAPGAGNMLVHRTVFAQIGGYDESLREAGEDSDFNNRLLAAGIQGWYSPRALAWHNTPPYRLTERYLRWKARRNGGHIARRDRQERGRAGAVLPLLARVGHALLVLAPRLAWARLRRDPQQALGARCRLWRAEGYIRFALHYLQPALFAQRSFFSEMDFRAERELFAPG